MHGCLAVLGLHREGRNRWGHAPQVRHDFEHLQPCIDWWGGKERQGREEGPQAWRVTLEDVKARGYNLDWKNPHTVADDHGDPQELLAQLDAADQEAIALRDQLKAILEEALLR